MNIWTHPWGNCPLVECEWGCFRRMKLHMKNMSSVVVLFEMLTISDHARCVRVLVRSLKHPHSGPYPHPQMFSSFIRLSSWFHRCQRMQQVLIIICLFTTWIPLIRDTSSRPRPFIVNQRSNITRRRHRKKRDKFDVLISCVRCSQNHLRRCLLIFGQTSTANH